MFRIYLFCVACFILAEGTSTQLTDDATEDLYATFSSRGLRGNVTFSVTNPGAPGPSIPGSGGKIRISVSITSKTMNEQRPYTLAVYELPTDYSKQESCNPRALGAKIADLSATLGPVYLPSEDVYENEIEDIALFGQGSIWGRTLVLDGPDVICASIQPWKSEVKTSIAQFSTPVGGAVTIRTVAYGDLVDSIVLADLFDVSGTGSASTHKWKIYSTDILESDKDRDQNNCNSLQIIFDPTNSNQLGCSPEEPEKCAVGDLSSKLGHVKISGSSSSRFGSGKKLYNDPNLLLSDLKGPRQLYVVIFEDDASDNFLACAKLKDLKARTSQAVFSAKGVKGAITFEQRSPYDLTRVSIYLAGLNKTAGGFHVHEFPFSAPLNKDDLVCKNTAGHYNPFGWNPQDSPSPGDGTSDVYELGDLSGKFGTLKELTERNEAHLDPSLPLFGVYSITGRSIVIHYASDGGRWICANIEPLGISVASAAVTFRYPLAGRIIFRQQNDDEYAETSVFVQSLHYSDGSMNDTLEHQFHIHLSVPNEDYHDWQERCKSAGAIYNPYNVPSQDKSYNSECSSSNPFRCMVGDLTPRQTTLTVAGSKKSLPSTRRFFTDLNLPLSGSRSILGRSMVLQHDNSPKQRGNRLACAPIIRVYRHKAVVNDWFPNGLDGADKTTGKVEFLQESEFSKSSIMVDFTGLQGKTSGYHIHEVSVQPELQFPCHDNTLYGHYNPYEVVPALSPPSGVGSNDQYELGDISGKFGTLAELTEFHGGMNDTNLGLYGPVNIMGRSIVIHRSGDHHRWACGTIGWGFSPSEAREVNAMASFHHPQGFAWGYIKMSQLVYADGATSDTIIEVNLKHPGKNNRNHIPRLVTTVRPRYLDSRYHDDWPDTTITVRTTLDREIRYYGICKKATNTLNHNWAVFVNPVVQDAAVSYLTARCTASGYMWNPAFVQIVDQKNDEFYSKECSSDTPLRCMVGDISGRLGPIELGGKRKVFSDKNLPLDGKMGIVGRSIVIMSNDFGHDKYACANIQPYSTIFKYLVIKKPSKFSPSRFMEDVRKVMGVPEWMMFSDSRFTEDVHGGRCVQFKLYFSGPSSAKLEQDFNRLLIHGRLDNPSLAIPGFYPDPKREKTIEYKLCSTKEELLLAKLQDADDEEDSKSSSAKPLGLNTILVTMVTVLFTMI